MKDGARHAAHQQARIVIVIVGIPGDGSVYPQSEFFTIAGQSLGWRRPSEPGTHNEVVEHCRLRRVGDTANKPPIPIRSAPRFGEPSASRTDQELNHSRLCGSRMLLQNSSTRLSHPTLLSCFIAALAAAWLLEPCLQLHQPSCPWARTTSKRSRWITK